MMQVQRRFKGFADESLDAQSTFRAMMMALAEPGHVQTVKSSPDAPEHLGPAFASIILTLIDKETPVWCDETLKNDADFREFLTFHTHAPLVDDPAKAAFAFVAQAAHCPQLSAFNPGDAAYPETSTTLVLAVQTLSGADEATLFGPGIATTNTIAAAPLPENFWAQWDANARAYPLGIDVLLCCGPDMIGLPRSSHRHIGSATQTEA